jgi:hypothetical protein
VFDNLSRNRTTMHFRAQGAPYDRRGLAGEGESRLRAHARAACPPARLNYESRAVGLDGNELGALLVAAGLGPPAEHALISLPALNGLRVSEVTGATIEALNRPGVSRGSGPPRIRRVGIPVPATSRLVRTRWQAPSVASR